MIINEPVRRAIRNFVSNPVHGLIVTGPAGSGKTGIAKIITAELLDVKPQQLENHPYVAILLPEKDSHGIDTIRRLQKFMQLKVPTTSSSINRVVIIQQADHMTVEAQNALLKSLEEPPVDTVIILTSPKTRHLKETIYSRVQEIQATPVTYQEAVAHYKDRYELEQIKTAHMISAGNAGILDALLGEADHELLAAVNEAKKLLAADMFSRLLFAEHLSKDREQASLLLQGLKTISVAALRNATQKSSATVASWHQRLEHVYEAEAKLPHNPNSKLLLTDLMLHL